MRISDWSSDVCSSDLLSVVATACLWSATPGPARLLPTLAFVVVAAVGFEIGTVFYNAMLPDIADRARIGRISGWGWGLGYLGGLACMILSLVGFVQTDDPWFGVGTEDAANIRRSEEHTSELQSLMRTSYAVFCLKKKTYTETSSS